MSERALNVAVVAGEVSGDLLGGDLIAALKAKTGAPVELVGVGGDALEAQGLHSLFDYSELSIMGITQVLARLPNLVRRIGQTADAIIAAKPDVLIIIDSPDFTHRVAKKVRAALPDLPIVNYVCPSVWAWKEYRAKAIFLPCPDAGADIIDDLPIVNYVCPSVWAWKEYRAKAMLPYVDRVLAVLPFEPEAMQRLGGPRTDFVGHRLTADPDILRVRELRAARPLKNAADPKTILLLPGSRGAEIKALLPIFGEVMQEFTRRNGPTRFILPTVKRREALVREIVAGLDIKPEVVVDQAGKWNAFTEADAAIAASGTVILELALATVPVVSAYKADWLITMMAKRIKIWSGALPNLIADRVVVPEYINEVVRAGALCRWAEQLSFDSGPRCAMLEGYDLTWQNLSVPVPPREAAAAIVLDLLSNKKPGH